MGMRLYLQADGLFPEVVLIARRICALSGLAGFISSYSSTRSQ